MRKHFPPTTSAVVVFWFYNQPFVAVAVLYVSGPQDRTGQSQVLANVNVGALWHHEKPVIEAVNKHLWAFWGETAF